MYIKQLQSVYQDNVSLFEYKQTRYYVVKLG